MTDDDPDDTTPDDAPEPDESDADAPDADSQPDLDDDEMADWEAVGDEVADELADEDDDQDDGDADQGDAPDAAPDLDPDQTSLGDVYCNALGMGAAVVRDQYGDLDRDREQAVDDYAAMARQLDLDSYVDDWLAEQGGIDNLSPGQGALLMTVLFIAMLAVEDPQIAGNVMDEVSGVA